MKTQKFGRDRDQRKALYRSLAKSLILHEKITTTEAKAKTIRPIIEKMITRAKDENLANRRILLQRLGNDKKVVDKLIAVSEKYKDKPGGYTRIVKIYSPTTDSRKQAIIELI